MAGTLEREIRASICDAEILLDAVVAYPLRGDLGLHAFGARILRGSISRLKAELAMVRLLEPST